MNLFTAFVVSDWAYMRYNKAKIKIYYKRFHESGLHYSLECSSKHLLQVSDKNGKERLEEEQYLHGDCFG